MISARIYFSGMVQGVGFRYTVRRYASNLNLNGWVRNLSDGRVEVLIEGEKEKIENLIENIDKQFEGYIRNKTIDYEPTQGKLNSFRITH
jgi:acylphosphatase